MRLETRSASPAAATLASIAPSALSLLTAAALSLAVPAPPAHALYLPRALYPGTYGNYCGPTPEVSRGCELHGRFGDAPTDVADAACSLHDLGYCRCEAAVAARQPAAAFDRDGTPLSPLAALRGVGSAGLLRTRGVDQR